MGRDGFAPPVCARRPAACRCSPRGAHHRGNRAVRGEIVWKVRPSMPDTAMVSGNPKRGAPGASYQERLQALRKQLKSRQQLFGVLYDAASAVIERTAAASVRVP